ncbi:MAG TPA: hypothetical protein GXX17_02690 [Clostridiales bacterium]|nr:hypothetical protein [Clostridiales bacterium]
MNHLKRITAAVLICALFSVMIMPVRAAGTFLSGDIDADGKLSVSDIIGLQRIIMGHTVIGSTTKRIADLNDDGQITVLDIVILRNMIMQPQLIYKFPADWLLKNINLAFWNDQGSYALETLESSNKAFLWPYGAYLEALSAGLAANPNDQDIKTQYIKALNGLENYRARRDYRVYHPGSGGWGDIYYDDNIWIVIAFLRAYKLLNDTIWLEKAKELSVFCYSGWSDVAFGGVRWNETDENLKVMCSTANLTIASCLLYKETQDNTFLDWAQKLYDWADKYMKDTDGLYFESYHGNGTINRTKWTVNAGCMIQAGVLMYEITQKDSYIQNAMQTAQAADSYFGTLQNGIYRFHQPEPWFHIWLLEGYIMLQSHVPNAAEYINHFSTAVLNGTVYKKAGFVPPSWGNSADFSVRLIDQSGTTAALYMLQKYTATKN